MGERERALDRIAAYLSFPHTHSGPMPTPYGDVRLLRERIAALEAEREALAQQLESGVFLGRTAKEWLEIAEEREALREALLDVRNFSAAVSDKDIGPLSESARSIQGKLNRVLDDVPSVEEVTGLLRAAIKENEA